MSQSRTTIYAAAGARPTFPCAPAQEERLAFPSQLNPAHMASFYATATRMARSVIALTVLLLVFSPVSAQQPPTSLRYPTPNVYITNASVVYLSPTVSGNVTSYSISPGLPAGLSFNTNTGVISGTPTAASNATTYTVTATNGSGSTNTTLSIQVTSSYYNNAFAQVSFTGASSTSISGSGTGQSVNDKILYSNVSTISGTQIDAIVTTTQLTNVSSWVAYDQNAASGGGYDSNDPKFFSPQVNFGTGGGQIRFSIQFILGGSYNASTNPTGTPVILQNVYLNSYDIDGNGNTGSNQYNLIGDFNSYTLGGSTQIGVSYDVATGLTKFRSNLDDNSTTITADAHRIRVAFNNTSTIPVILGSEANGAAYYFLDFSAGPAFTTSTVVTAPTIDLGTAQTGVNNDSAGCASGIPFTRGATNVSTPTGNSFDSLLVSIPTSQLLNTTNEQLLVNGASAGGTIALGSTVSTTTTLGGISYTTTSVTRNNVRYVKFARSGTTAAQLEALIDALQYRNIAASPTNGTRTFTVNAYNSVGASPDAIFNATVSCVVISGNIYHDADGLANSTVDANGTQFTANQLYAVLTSQSSNLVLATTGIAAGGAYSFGAVDKGNYNIFFRTSAPAVGASVTSSTYPSGTSGAYVSTGENLGATSGNDGLVDGKLVITIGSTSVTNANFGLELPPTTTSTTINNVANPGGFNNYTVPISGGFTYADEDGSVQSITITSFPTGANYIRVNGTTYTNGGTCPPQSTCTAWPGTLVVPVAQISTIAVDPAATGNTSVVIPFRATDNANVNDVNASPNSVTINFIAPVSPITISGNVWDDANGDGVKGGTEQYTNVASAGQTLYALLVQTTNTYSGAPTIYASTPVTAAATGYSFSSVPSGNNYEVRLASLAAQPTDGVALSTITQSVATGWTDVSYNNNGVITNGLNTTAPVITLGNVTSNKLNVNFGLDALPTAVTGATTNAVNPGGTNNATVPATSFSGTDAVDLAGGSIAYVRITAFPANATSITITGATTAGGPVSTVTYTSGTFPSGGVYVATAANGNLSNASAVQVDPVNGAVAVSVPFRVIDGAGIESANAAAANISFSDLTISGTVYNDTNGGTINGTTISNAGGQLYVNLVSGGSVVASQTLTNGTFSFNTANGLQNNVGTYTLVVTNSASAITSILPSAAWTYTAEGTTGGTGDGTANGTYSFGGNVTTSQVIDFGLDALPTTTVLTTATTQQNPGGTNTVTIPATTFNGTDADAANGGIISYVRITAFPSNATSITITGATTIGGPVSTVTYTSGTFPAGGVFVATASNGNLSDATAVKVDPVNGAVNVDISYKVVDNAGKESTATGAARQPLSDFAISGNVYDDPDAAIINGTLLSNAGGQLYVNLVSGGVVVSSKAVTLGAYSFSTADGLQNNVSNYQLVLTNSAVAVTSVLPSNTYTYTAEGIAGTTGDGTANGIYSFGGNVTTNTAIDFGLDALPTVSALNTATSQVNPGGTATVVVPSTTFTGADAGDISGGQVNYIWLTSFPTNATTITVTASTTIGGPVMTTTYGTGFTTFPVNGLYIATSTAGNPTTPVLVDPVNGAVNVDFSYRTIDNAGKPSNATGIARQPLSDLTISGTVYDDANAGVINGTAISTTNGQLYVNLINTANNTVVASQQLTNGTYSFGTANGVLNNVSTYAVILTTGAASTTPALGAGFVNTGEGISGTSGDANANGRYLFGTNVTTSQVIDFGVDALPTPATLTTAPGQVNPGGTATVTIPPATFTGTDAGDVSGLGAITYIHIVSFPANATTVNFLASSTTLNGTPAAASYTSANFPVGGVYIATNSAGNPSSAITVDPVNGAVNVDFTYTVIDNASQESLTSGIARQPLTDLTITGSVYDDVTAGVIDGSLISNAGGQLYVNLISGGAVVASKAVSGGTYTFTTADGLRNNVADYSVILTSGAAATTATLPSAQWVYIAEGTSGTTGDGAVNGSYSFGGAITTSKVIDFAIEALPVPASTTATSQVNPGGTATVTVPVSTFVASDATDLSGGAVKYIHITSFPTNTTTVNFSDAAIAVNGTYGPLSYTSGTWPNGGVYLKTADNGNPNTSTITVDPVNGAVNVDFTFTAIDNTGKESVATGLARQPLSDLTISGIVYDDPNGSRDNTISGTAVGSLNSTQLYANLVKAGVVIGSQALPTAGGSTGTFSFTTANTTNLTQGGDYSVVITTSALSTGAALPAGWVNTSEGIAGVNDLTPNGVIDVTNLTNSVNLIYGVNATPTASSSTITALANPGGTVNITIPAASFPGTDPDTNGEIAYVRLVSFPTNATTITVYGATTYGGTPSTVTYTLAAFNALPNGIFIPTDGPGYLLPVDALKIDPVDGATQSVFSYTVYDIAGLQSNVATTTVPYISGAISGTVYNDYTALLDNTINGVGTNLSAQGGPVYVYAIDNTNTVAGKGVVGSNGTYVISGLGSANYTLLLTTANVLVGAATPAQTLPTGWIFTGEGLTPAGDGSAPNGQISVTLTSDGIANADFGIDARPIAVANTIPSQVNPGFTNKLTIPATAFSGTDVDAANGGEIEYVRITALPANVTSVTITGSLTRGGAVSTVTYGPGFTTFPGTGVYIATNDDGNLLDPTAVQVDPIDGGNPITIDFKVIDNAGQESTNTATITQSITDLLITGTVYDDVNGGIINGTATSSSSIPLFVNLVNTNTNAVVASKHLTNGTFSFGTANGVRNDINTYALVLTDAAGNTVATIGSGWDYTAEGATGTTGDGAANGTYSFNGFVTTSQVIDFGIDALPTAANNTAVSVVNPGSTNTVTVPASTFSGSDNDPISGDIISYVRITAFPTNATSITITGATTLGGAVSTVTYGPGFTAFPGGGIFIATAANGNLSDANAVKVDPVNGAVDVVITYAVIDNAGKESAATATATQPLTELSISGTVYNDVDGATDNLIDGVAISNAGGQLYVNLVNSGTGTVVSSKTLTNGTFTFTTADGLSTDVTTFQVILANSPTDLAPALNSGWSNTGEGLTNTVGDGFPNGRYQVNAITTSRVIDFGIDALPVPAIITTAATQTNPGGTNTVTVPATTFVATDADAANGGEVRYIRITAFPTNATSITVAGALTAGGAVSTVTYGPGFTAFPSGGIYIATAANGNLSDANAVKVDPVDGAVNVDITYHAIDNAGKESTVTGTARQPLSDLLITGSLYDDVDAGSINGTRISTVSGIPLYVNLVDTASSTVIASQLLSTGSGTYSFGTANGLRNDVTTYKLVLTTSAASATPALGTIAWVNTAEGLTNTTGDGNANGGYALGGAVTTNKVIDFGVEARPVAVPLTVATPKVNPGGSIFIGIANNLPLGLDPVDTTGGQVSRLRVTSFPTNVDQVTVVGFTTLNGPLVRTTYTSLTWPGTGVYVGTNATGSTLDSFFIDPVDGADTVRIQFRAIDQAGYESNNTGIGKIPITELAISGRVYNDVDGNTDGIVDGTLISNADGQLYVNLVDGTNTIIASKAVTNGVFSFTTLDGVRSDVTTYRLVLAASAAATTQGLPATADWVNTGEGPTGAPDGLANGRYTFSTAVTSPISIDFGIDARPLVTALNTAVSQLNPGGTTTVTIPAGTFTGSDADAGNGGVVEFIRITSFPTNATSIQFANGSTTIDGTYGPLSYTAATFPTGGVFVAANTSGNPTSAISVDPTDGAVDVDVRYVTIDNAQVESKAPGIARQPLSTLTISGTIVNDVNGLTDNLVNGSAVLNTNGALFVNAIDGGNNVVGSAVVANDGTYSITGLYAGNYNLVLTTSASANFPALAAGWATTGEGSGTTPDGSANGTTSVTLVASNVTNINFGIDALPTPANNTAVSQANPGATNTVTVPASTFSGTDADAANGGIISYVRILDFPSNATSITIAGATSAGGAVSTVTYTAATFPTGGVYIATAANGNLSDANAVKIDPIDGAVSLVMPYSVIDNAGKESAATANATQPLSDLTITGTIYNDVDAGTINGTPIANAGAQLYVNLVNTFDNSILASRTVTATSPGFSFGTADGLRNDVSTYQLVLTTSNSSIAAALGSDQWVYTAEGASGTSGDALANGTYTFGGAVTSAQVIDFGVDKLPVPAALTVATAQGNPGGTNNVVVPATTFVAADGDAANGGEVRYIRITSFPSNATTISFASGSETINGTYGPLTYTSLNFPGTGVFVATNATGNPLTDISVDPIDGAARVDISFAAIDNAGKESTTTGIARQPLTSFLITGNVFDDFNGLTDGAINGPATDAGGSLYVVAVDGGNNIMGSTLVEANGRYTIGSLSAGNYILILTTSALSTTPALPAGWVTTGEGSGTTPDATANGRLQVNISNADVTDQNFGIEQPAVADAKSFLMNQYTNPAFNDTTVTNTANNSIEYVGIVSISGSASSGATPGAPTALDNDNNAGSAETLTSGTGGVSLVIDPATYSGTRHGQSYPNAMMLVYDGVQLQAGGCQGTDVGSPVCQYYNSTSGKWEIPAYDESKLFLLARNGSQAITFQYAFQDAAGKTGDFAAYTVQFGEPLPVHLLTFNGVKRNKTAVLTWTAENESNFRGYAVERSLTGSNFEQIGFLNGRNATGVQQYGYNDDLSNLRGNRVYYRLKQVDLNGSFTYSSVVTLTLDNSVQNNAVTVLSNPVKGTSVRLQVRSGANVNAQFVVIDGAGRIIASKQQQLTTGTTAIGVELPGYAANGVYTVVTILGEERFTNKVLLDR